MGKHNTESIDGDVSKCILSGLSSELNTEVRDTGSISFLKRSQARLRGTSSCGCCRVADSQDTRQVLSIDPF